MTHQFRVVAVVLIVIFFSPADGAPAEDAKKPPAIDLKKAQEYGAKQGKKALEWNLRPQEDNECHQVSLTNPAIRVAEMTCPPNLRS